MLQTTTDRLTDYRRIREFTEQLTEPLEPEDFVVQSMPDASPVKWHLAHTSWFFETFLLKPTLPNYEQFSQQFEYLFNSYYNAIGERHPRPERGMITRPSVGEVFAYRHHVDAAMQRWLTTEAADAHQIPFTVGLHHEQQHQELLLTDLKHLFSRNPLCPAYRDRQPSEVDAGSVPDLNWIEHPAGLAEIGVPTENTDFAYDNETPRHREYLESFSIADRPVTNREYLRFIEAGGYRDPQWWLSAGWDVVRTHGWEAPGYWRRSETGSASDNNWETFTLRGLEPMALDEPVCHVSFFEADAFARFCGVRLPTEAEWEHACDSFPPEEGFVEDRWGHPGSLGSETAPTAERTPRHMLGEVWEWTASQYRPYPGYRPPAGALGEYNGKFMCNQFVLRGGSCATSRSHIRMTYRNFFDPAARWQFSGIRLAR